MKSLRFEERSLKADAEPVSIGELKEGEVYFAVQFAGTDQERLLPITKTLVFVGLNLEKTDEQRVYFQDVESYQAGVRYGTSTVDDGAIFYSQESQDLKHIFEYENALNELLKCSLRRKALKR